MNQLLYREQDYAFGQQMLTLRTKTGLTQAGLGERLGVSRRAVAEWEAGNDYPKPENLKAFLALCIRQQAFHSGCEAEEIRALWQAAHQKVLLDELWLQTLLDAHRPQLSPVSPLSGKLSRTADQSAPLPGHGPRVDWGNAPDAPSFYGREQEMTSLTTWVVEEHCRLVSVLGMGGIGKSALATRIMHRVAPHFEIVLWHSLRGAPDCESILDDCLHVLAPERLRDMSVSLERRLSLLMECLRHTRVLLVLDNLETLLEEGQSTGHFRPAYEGYARLLRMLAETEHQSCLLLTSREKPGDLIPLEGTRNPVRSLRLARLDAYACQLLLADKEIAGSEADQAQLIEAYAGNPLALNIIAQTIVELFAGEIALFLEQGEVVFGGVRELLDEQFDRLANLEQTLLCRLAIARQPVTLNQLRALFVLPRTSGELLESVHRLRQRCLIEYGQNPGSFTLQSLMLEYVNMRFGGEQRDHAGAACVSDPAWTFPGLYEGAYPADLGALAAGFRDGMLSAYPPETYSGGRAVKLTARATSLIGLQ